MPKPKRTYVSQALLPKRSLRDAMLISQAINDQFGGGATAPHQVALALDISPTSSAWRDLTGSAVAYGLTEGASNSNTISLTDLGRRCVAPTEEGDDVRARAEASLRPKVLKDFFAKYNKAKFPSDVIARNVLVQNLDVPQDKADEIFEIIKDNGTYVGIIHQTKTGPYVAIEQPEPAPTSPGEVTGEPGRFASPPAILPGAEAPAVAPPRAAAAGESFKVFISHGKNMEVVQQVKDVLALYDIDFEVAVEEETTAIPVPQKVMDAMRRCHAGVMVVTADEQNKVGAEFGINNNVLIEIGAAFVLYNQRVVLLWDKRIKVPSNLQGLYRCEFEGSELSFAVGTKLAKAVKSFKQ